MMLVFMLFSEVGRDMSRWPDAGHLVSWLGLCPDNDISGGKVLWRGARRTRNRAGTLFRMAAYSLHRDQSPIGDYLRRMKAKLGPAAATTATSNPESGLQLPFRKPVYAAEGDENPDFESGGFRYRYRSFITPESVYEYDPLSAVSKLLTRQEVPGYDPSQYASERLWATARDGTKVPLSVLYKKGLKRDGTAPLFLYAYGSYGYGTPDSFSSSRLALIDRGMAFAIAHIRGGDEMGETWRRDGMLMKKKNTFFDFIDSAEYLIEQKWTSKDRLVIEGASAGGMLMGAVVNLRPDLFRAVHMGVPFVDVMNDMMDASLPLTTEEYLEWGNPNEKAAYDYMLGYSPYDNLRRGAHPAILVTESFNDSQVFYWEAAKYVARLRTLKTDDHQLILKMKMDPAGHGGASGRYDRLHDTAFEYSWLLSQVGIRK
jgi:oligopeptidase B